jgi:hypothetical protein
MAVIKQKCPGCGRMVDTLWTYKKEFDSCKFCNPHIKGRSTGQVLHDLQEQRKKEDSVKTKKRTKR